MTRFALWKSDRSPPAESFEPFVREIMTSFGAVWLDDDDAYDLRLRDGVGIEVWFEGDDGGVDFILEAPHEGAFELIFAVADQAACFTTSGSHAQACALASTGGVRAEDEGELASISVVDRHAFMDWMRAETTGAARPPRSPPDPYRVQRSFWQRLSDALFGKEM